MRDRDTLAKLTKWIAQPKPARVQPGTQSREKLDGIFHVLQFNIPWASQGEMSHALSLKVPFLPAIPGNGQSGTRTLNALFPFEKSLHHRDKMDRVL